MELLEYDLDIMHRPGRHCHMPDLLTRAELEEDPVLREQMVLQILSGKAKEAIDQRLLNDKAQEAIAQRLGQMRSRNSTKTFAPC
jgi:hypothetical protein